MKCFIYKKKIKKQKNWKGKLKKKFMKEKENSTKCTKKKEVVNKPLDCLYIKWM